MAGPPLTELSARARDIFRLVVEGYIASGLPVGSKTLAGSAGIQSWNSMRIRILFTECPSKRK